MPKLNPLSLAKFQDISWEEFIEKSEFTEECIISSEFGPINKALTTIFHDKIIKDFSLKEGLNDKKKILLFSFYLNTVFTRLQLSQEHLQFHMIGIFLFLIELEEEFKERKNKSDKKTNLDRDLIVVKRFFFQLKRRIFNIFLYFNCLPRDLESYLNEFKELTKNNTITIGVNMFSGELNKIISRMEFKKQRCLLEYFKHYSVLQEKSGNMSKTECIRAYFAQIPFCLSDTIKKNKEILNKNAAEFLLELEENKN